MLLTTQYFNYFRQKAISHKDLQHDPAWDTGTGQAGKKRFARISYEEFLSGLRSKIDFPALFAEQFEIVISGETESPSQLYSGAITVLATADQEQASKVAEASDLTLTILSDILRSMYNDHYGEGVSMCTSPFEDLKIDMNLMPVGPVLNSQFGWRCEFNFKMLNGLELTKAPDPGTFI